MHIKLIVSFWRVILHVRHVVQCHCVSLLRTYVALHISGLAITAAANTRITTITAWCLVPVLSPSPLLLIVAAFSSPHVRICVPLAQLNGWFVFFLCHLGQILFAHSVALPVFSGRRLPSVCHCCRWLNQNVDSDNIHTIFLCGELQ